MIGTFIELTPEQRRVVTAFQRVYGSVRVRSAPHLRTMGIAPGCIVVEGFTRPRTSGRRRVIHAILVTP